MLFPGQTFDIEDLFLRNLVGAVEYPRSSKVYAPWIQMLINMAQGKRHIFCHGPKILQSTSEKYSLGYEGQ